jgi:hypothetical protein
VQIYDLFSSGNIGTPKISLLTYNDIVQGESQNAFYQSIVAYDEIQKPTLLVKQYQTFVLTSFLQIDNHQLSEIMDYGGETKTEFQRYISNLVKKCYTFACTDVQFLL